MRPISDLTKSVSGQVPLPAGAIPLAEDKPTSMVCLMPTGAWIRWWPVTSSIESMPNKTQRAVMDVIVAQLGGTASAAAERLEVSPRTVEAWRSCAAALPPKAAYLIAQKLAEK